jgi:DNA topoisomerase-1
MENATIDGTAQEKRLYDLIWKRSVASQMAEAQIEKTTVNINIGGQPEKFVARGEVIVFDGFLKVYKESTDDDEQSEEFASLPALQVGEQLSRETIASTERFSQGPSRYTEASLVHKLEELGIGRPSTYAPTISTIQQRDYVEKGDRGGKETKFTVDILKGNQVESTTKTEFTGSEKGKLIPTDIGIVVNDFLLQNFPEIMDYNFTAKVENQFDKIAEGKEEWKDMMSKFDKPFEKTVDQVMKSRSEHKAGERILGKDPKTGRTVLVKIGKFGPLAQIGTADDDEKPRFAQIPKGKSIETITLDEALELFKLPRELGEFEGMPVTIGAGRFGPYVQHNKKYVSLPKEDDPMTVTLDHAISLILAKRLKDREREIKTFEEDDRLELLKGRFGPYLAFDGNNYRIDKSLHDRALAGDLSYDECMEIIKNAPEPKAKARKRK